MRWSAMTHVDSEAGSDEEVDPRWVRSRTRLLDAAADLLRAGGIEAVTIDAVTRESRVARTTLYRHFGCSSDLLAATLERLLPPVTPPPSTGSLRVRPDGPDAAPNRMPRGRVVHPYSPPLDAILQSPEAHVHPNEFALEL